MNNQFDDLGNIIKKDLSRLEHFKIMRKRKIIVRKYLIELINDLSVSIERLTYEIDKLELNNKSL